ncbi:hypothetical protein DCC79_08275 [bacterium]|nr:DUF1648 domain-containing protein [Chloroflexi bacterium CFX6]RIL10365.1 MAG: hypothetical protein DCC79_08275 [bacterium]
MLASAAWFWRAAPDRIPVHWNLAGEPDRYGGKVEGLLFVPLLSVGLYVLLRVLPRFDPARDRYARFQGAYDTLRVGILGVMAVLYAVILLWVSGRPVDVGLAVGTAVGALMVLLGWVMPRLEPNWFVGIRTPWTLSSGTAWRRTHAAGRPVFVLAGVLMALAGWLKAPWALGVAFGGLLAGTLALVVYSYVVWRDAPDRVPPGGTP